MRTCLVVILFLVSVKSFAQKTDFVNVRLYNSSKCFVKKLVVTIDNKNYVFSDILNHKFSDYKQLPYIWTSNPIDVIIIEKKFLRHNSQLHIIESPIDHIGDKKITGGNITLILTSYKEDNKLNMELKTTK